MRDHTTARPGSLLIPGHTLELEGRNLEQPRRSGGGRGALILQRCGSPTPAVLRDLHGPSLPLTRGLHPRTRHTAHPCDARPPLTPVPPPPPRLPPGPRPAIGGGGARAGAGERRGRTAAAASPRSGVPLPGGSPYPPPGVRSPADVALCPCCQPPSILLQPPGEYRGAGHPPGVPAAALSSCEHRRSGKRVQGRSRLGFIASRLSAALCRRYGCWSAALLFLLTGDFTPR